ELEQPADLDLADPLARQVHDLADFLERDPAALGDIERAGVLELPGLEVGKVDLDRAGLGVDVQIEVMLARDPGARPQLLPALGARGRPRDVDRRIHQRTLTELLAGQPLHRDRLAARPGPAAPAPDLAAHLGGWRARAGDFVVGIAHILV